jgi:hypothetical protein
MTSPTISIESETTTTSTKSDFYISYQRMSTKEKKFKRFHNFSKLSIRVATLVAVILVLPVVVLQMVEL